MKKNYMTPKTKVCAIEPHNTFLCMSSFKDQMVDGGEENSFVNEEREDFSGQNIWGAGW